MRLPPFGRDRSVQFNVTPLIDVVFLLIIFFLVNSHLAQQEIQMDLALPTAASGHELQESKIQRVTINLLPDGRLFLGSDEIGVEEIQRRLEIEKNQTSDDLEIRFRADRQVAYRYVEPLLLACTRAGIWNVSFAVIEKESSEW
jgi:biopolymer transport protein ExbD